MGEARNLMEIKTLTLCGVTTNQNQRSQCCHLGNKNGRYTAKLLLSRLTLSCASLTLCCAFDRSALSRRARRDRGAGAFLVAAGVAPGEVVSVGLREVDPDEVAPPRDEGPPAYDWIVFTPRVDRSDPCAALPAPGAP